MAIPKMTDDLNIIQALSDLPNLEDGLTADQLKAKFDAAGLAIQNYLNNTLIPAMVANRIPFSSTTAIAAETVQAAIENVQEQVRGASTGTIVNGAITKEKLAEELLARVYGGLAWVSADTPDSADTPLSGFPLGQMWLRPAFSVTNEAGSSWSGSGCTAEKSGYDVVITGSTQVATVTATQSLTDLGNQGDRVLVLFTVKDQDSEITALAAAINGGEDQTVSGNVTLEGTLSVNGSLSVQFTVAWPSASLADGSVTLGSYTVVNLDKLMRQITGAKEIADWGSYVWGLAPFTTHQSPAAVFIQETPGQWRQTSYEVLPVNRGGTGLNALGEEGTVLQVRNGSPAWSGAEQVVQTLGALRALTGSYTGTETPGSVTLPVTPALLLIFPDSASSGDTGKGGLAENPFLLGNGATATGQYTGTIPNGDSRTYTCSVALSGNLLTFGMNADSLITDASDKFGNRSGVTYHWVAIY